MAKFVPACARMIEDPVNHRYLAQRGSVKEIPAADPALVQLRVDTEHADRVFAETAAQAGPTPRRFELEGAAFDADLPEVLAQVLRIDAVVFVTRVADLEVPGAR